MKPSPAQKQPSENNLPPREIGVAHNVVADFRRRHPNFRGYDFEDLRQECLLHWLARRHQFRPGRGASRSTFMGKILRRKLLDLLDEQMSDKRQVNQRTESFKPSAEDENSLETPPSLENNPDAEKTAIHLRLSVQKVLAEMHPDQVRLCELMQEGKNVTEMARELKKSRSALYDELKRIKEIFQREDLREFL